MNISGITGAPAPVSGVTPPAGGSENAQSAFDKILADFNKEASETPAQRAADAVLKKHGLTQDDLNKLPKAQRDAIQQEIAQAVKRALGVDQAKGAVPGSALERG